MPRNLAAGFRHVDDTHKLYLAAWRRTEARVTLPALRQTQPRRIAAAHALVGLGCARQRTLAIPANSAVPPCEVRRRVARRLSAQLEVRPPEFCAAQGIRPDIGEDRTDVSPMKRN